jgi:vesicular inhibitory amino acid transporter
VYVLLCLEISVSSLITTAPWGGHSVFPNIYRDMRHPYKYGKAVKLTFSFTYLLDAATAMAGYLMFGDGVLDELTANLLNEPGYPRFLSILLTIFIAIIPLTKLPLNARPIISTIETFSGLHVFAVSESGASIGPSPFTRTILKFAIRILVIIVFVITAILFPSFDSIMAFMGSALCFSICVILPLLFHLKIFGDRISPGERWWNWFLIVVSSVMAAVGTVFSFLPKSVIERM